MYAALDEREREARFLRRRRSKLGAYRHANTRGEREASFPSRKRNKGARKLGEKMPFLHAERERESCWPA